MGGVRTVLTAVLRLLRHRLVILCLLIGGAGMLAYASRTAEAFGAQNACGQGTYSDYFSSIPYGTSKFSTTTVCSTCHQQTSPSVIFKPFGTDYYNQPIVTMPDSNTVHAWSTALAALDSSGNGYTNGEKLQDPTGAWQRGDPDPGTASRVVANLDDPTSIPPAPALTGLSGITSGATVQGIVTLAPSLDTTIGARSMVYDILDGSQNVVMSYGPLTTNSTYGGYTPFASTFNLSWDTTGVPNGVYTVRATLSDARVVAQGGPRTSQVSVANVTIDNASVRYVAPTGTDGGGTNDCKTSNSPCLTLDQAVSQAQNFDSIRLAAGTYTPGSGTNALQVSTDISISGGYSTANWATAPDPVANPTVLDGQNQRTVLSFAASASGFSLQGVTIQHGSGTNGGGVAVGGASSSFQHVTFAGNQASGTGGGLWLGSSATLHDVSFSGNSAGSGGGAIATVAPLQVTTALFAGNTAPQGAALDSESGGTVSLTYTTIAGSASPSSAIYVAGGGTITSVTIENSLLSGYATGVRLNDLQVSLVIQTSLAANDPANAVATPVSGGGSSISGSFLTGLAGYTNAAAGNYHLAFGAPAIDAATTVNGITTDLDGNPRPAALPGNVPDIGAYEFQGPLGQLGFDNLNMTVTHPASSINVMVDLSVPSVSPVSVA